MLIELREKYGVSYSFMARKANMNDSTFRKFIYGYRSISEKNLEKIQILFDLDFNTKEN